MANPVAPLVTGGLFKEQANDGTPLQGGLVYFYITGTTTAKNTYSESTGTTANANPVVLDSRGEAAIYLLLDQDYKMVVKTSAGATVYTRDPVKPITETGSNKLLIVDGIAEPDTISGIAQIYVDTADGDLKVKFGDGTVTVIAADT